MCVRVFREECELLGMAIGEVAPKSDGVADEWESDLGEIKAADQVSQCGLD